MPTKPLASGYRALKAAFFEFLSSQWCTRARTITWKRTVGGGAAHIEREEPVRKTSHRHKPNVHGIKCHQYAAHVPLSVSQHHTFLCDT
jgi:hypothetical protein